MHVGVNYSNNTNVINISYEYEMYSKNVTQFSTVAIFTIIGMSRKVARKPSYDCKWVT
jgi:hypothetical protein